jgi:hypothetical protein
LSVVYRGPIVNEAYLKDRKYSQAVDTVRFPAYQVKDLKGRHSQSGIYTGHAESGIQYVLGVLMTSDGNEVPTLEEGACSNGKAPVC